MRRALIAIVGTVTAAALAGPASATQIVNVPSTVTIAGKGLHFHGKVGAANSGCLGGRTVRLLRVGGQKLGTTKTKANGSWKLTVSGSAGISMASFYAKVKKRSEGTAGTIYVCGRARSAKVPYSP